MRLFFFLLFLPFFLRRFPCLAHGRVFFLLPCFFLDRDGGFFGHRYVLSGFPRFSRFSKNLAQVLSCPLFFGDAADLFEDFSDFFLGGAAIEQLSYRELVVEAAFFVDAPSLAFVDEGFVIVDEDALVAVFERRVIALEEGHGVRLS